MGALFKKADGDQVVEGPSIRQNGPFHAAVDNHRLLSGPETVSPNVRLDKWPQDG